MDLLRALCFGQDPMAFLKQELSLNPLQIRVAKRIFVLLIVFSLVLVATRLPSTRVVAFFLAILLPQTVQTTRMAMDTARLFALLIGTAITLGLMTILLWQDEGWFRFPFTIGLIVLMVFFARINGIPNIVAIFFGTLVLYNVENPLTSIDDALWDIVILGGGLILACLMLAFVLWPMRANALLRERIELRLEEINQFLAGLMAGQIEGNPSKRDRLRGIPGWAAESLKHLEDAIRDQPDFAARKNDWIDCILEIDSLHSGLTAYQIEREKRPLPEGPDAAVEARLVTELRERADQALYEFRGVKGFPAKPPTNPSSHASTDSTLKILSRQLMTVERLRLTIGLLHQEMGSAGPPDAQSARILPRQSWISEIDWQQNRGTLLWSLKVGLACFTVSLIVISLNADQIDTAILTTIIVADSTLGADYRKSALRILGALFGAILGYLWLTLGQPMADTVAGLLATLLPFFAICAIVAATSPRLNYAGLQTGLAFCMVVFAEQAPESYLGTGWYRVLGILLGILVMGFLDSMLWPARSIDMARQRLRAMVRELRQQFKSEPMGSLLTSVTSNRIIYVLDTQTRDALYLLDFANLEPGDHREVQKSQELTHQFAILGKILESRHRVFLKGPRKVTDLMFEKIQAKLYSTYTLTMDVVGQALEDKVTNLSAPPLLTNLERLIVGLKQQPDYQRLPESEVLFIDNMLDLERRYVKTWLSICQNLAITQNGDLR